MSEELAQLRRRLQSLKDQCREIGQVPPRPPGWRAALGGVGVALMHRLMFWYAPALRRIIGGLIETVDEAIETLDGAIGQERVTSIAMENTLREQSDGLQQFAEEQRQKEEELERRLETADERLRLLRRETLENTQRLVRLLEEVRRRAQGAPQETAATAATAAAAAASEAPGGGSAALAGAPEDNGGLDLVFAALESAFRGTRGEAQARWKIYLPLIPRDGAVLDIGCGRGEWLELLCQEGISARGVDDNRLMVAECRERRLEVEQADALEYLARTPDGSLGAVTVLRLVEHLPLPRLVRLLDEVARVLRLGGTAIFETPNPENLLVAARDFYKDPARVHPIPAETLRFLVESRGFGPAEVMLLNPGGDAGRLSEDGESAVTRRFNRYFYGPRDYAVVGRKV